jgi:hypothetical protein
LKAEDMATKLKHDATESAAAIIYQFYVAVDRCFDLVGGEKVYIEKYGDITISEREQIEVKQYSDKLTDLHENIWKTISNWLQEGFDQSKYKDLILFTTQEFGENSSLKGWNNKSKSEKVAILDSIAVKYKVRKSKSAETEALVDSVLSPTTKDKLNDILGRFQIYDTSPRDYDYFNRLKEKHGKGVLSGNREAFINGLLGFLVSPREGGGKGWEITCEEFSQQVEALTSQYSSGTKIFPKKYLSNTPSEQEMSEKKKHLFVKKIEEIEYGQVVEAAITDYINANKTVNEELSKYAVEKKQYDNYEVELLNFFEPRYRSFSRKANASNVLDQSKDFYDEVTGSGPQVFNSFYDTPISFRNGMLHNMADDEDKEIKWKLEVKRDE